MASHRRSSSGSAGTRRFDDIALLYPASDMVERTFQQDELRLHVRRFDPHNLYDAQGGGLDRVELVPLTLKSGTEAGETR